VRPHSRHGERTLNLRLARLLCVFLVFAVPMAARQKAPANSPSNEPSQQATPGQPASPVQQNSPAQTSAPEQQVPAAAQASPLEKPNGAQQNASAPADQVKPKDDRILYTLPNYLTVENADHAPKLTVGEKYKLVAKDTFDWIEYPYVGAIAAIGQAQNSEPGYGQGWDGYAKRYGATFADTAVASFMTSAVLPSMLKEDPRYYQLGNMRGGFWRRAGYGISRIFVTRTDSGQSQCNYSELAGNLAAAGITNLYHPAADRTVTNTLSIWGTQTMWDALANEMKEFWPDLHHWIGKKKPD